MLVVAGLGACAPPAPSGPVDLVVPDGWRLADPADDPFPEHRAASKGGCDPSGVRPEEGALEVETDRCGYAALLQGTRAEVAAGQPLSLLLWHLTLVSADEGAAAHVAVLLDGDALFDVTLPLPAASDVYEVEVPAARTLPAGAPVAFHVHNHGANSYRLGHLRSLPVE